MSLAFMNNWSTSEADLCIFTNIVETIGELVTEHVHGVVSSDWRAVLIVVIQLSDPCGCRGLSGLVICLPFSPSGPQSNLQSLIELKLASIAGTTACQGGNSVSFAIKKSKMSLSHSHESGRIEGQGRGWAEGQKRRTSTPIQCPCAITPAHSLS